MVIVLSILKLIFLALSFKLFNPLIGEPILFWIRFASLNESLTYKSLNSGGKVLKLAGLTSESLDTDLDEIEEQSSDASFLINFNSMKGC